MPCKSLDPPHSCTDASPEKKLYRAFIFSIPVLFTLILLLLFYFFYLRRRRVDWVSMRIRILRHDEQEMARSAEFGIKKEVTEMFPVVVFKETFSIRESQCSVCLGEYKSEDRLKRIPPCGHTFHVDCIDYWLASNVTCPLCRSSPIPTPRASLDPTDLERQPYNPSGLSQNLEVVFEDAAWQTDEADTTVIRNTNEPRLTNSTCTGEDQAVSGMRNPVCRNYDQNTTV